MSEQYLPTCWYNLIADLPTPPPPALHPATHQPLTPEDLAALFPMACIEQEVATDRYIPIPEEVREIYKLWRPTPLRRALRLEKALETPAKIYYKYEGASPVGSHKPNTAVAQAYYNRREGITRLTTETGAGQWGSALAMAGAFLGIKVQVYMVKVSYYQKPYRRVMMESFGARVTPSPSEETESGRAILAQDPDSNGSLGVAISEAVEVAVQEPHTKYSLGSVLNHVLLHQTVIGEEALQQLEEAGAYPDVVIGCVGGGSNFGGIAFPFLGERLRDGRPTRFIAVEPAACPTLTQGRYAYDYGDVAKLTPLMKMYTLGHTFMPAGIHAGGLRYHGMAPLISQAVELGYIEPRAYPQLTVFDAAMLFARNEGIIPAPETAHAIRAAIDEALDAKARGEERVILFNFSGHGFMDMAAYQSYLAGELVDYNHTEEKLAESLACLPPI
ncbi:MAG TPA: TrpB-like pyridoxal phosphate-dependent enzyme [Anaerolineae bacterium]|nr:MAG: Tryptophan synthase beta chain [Chloroflexi bacterium ADurb.Bin222]HOC20035.1 TrpB-like pyridoxal phosphate-dependent enzyme [Anaerolineae bacterium]HOS79945.1 TrpB-like pyridoxal phosphate-dependent enzyme [Anaerolineae bacterium]HQE99080.1 TrpB-like pyridoxal phosphate-dependent enzyme [Anaerolineae bacterium]HQJ10219.1 TrpB-like pyridoxal phosphate-dependent enzyme [Anaerolineae bacterium]